MASITTEAAFLASFWHTARAGHEAAVRIIGNLQPEMLEYAPVGEAYQILANRYAKGDPLDDLEAEAELTTALGAGWFKTIQTQSQSGGKLGDLTKRVLFNYRARKQADLLARMAADAAKLVDSTDDSAAALADRAIGKLASLHTTRGDQGKPVSRDEITQHTLTKIKNRGTVSTGVPFPYDKLNSEIGFMQPGDVVGVAGYSNSGKSLLASNFWRHFAIAGIPTISFPTEMGLAWYDRGVATHARVPQMIAERGQWAMATDDMVESYELAVRDLGTRPWEIVDKPSIGVSEIIARASVLRRRWPGQPVVVIVDHMHRLDYGREEADFAVGTGTKRLRNWAKEDTMGGIILLLLYQPRKPSDEIELYRPVDGFRIRGKSEVWNELDVLLSPYRRWVMADSANKTPWGTQATLYDRDYNPMFALPNKEGAKLDDERVYVKIGKRRVGGEGPTCVLNIESPTGYIYQIQKPRLQAVIGGAR
jgi:replicative DNA helicase